MALFADGLGRTRIDLGHENRPLEVASHRVIELLDAVQFRLEVRSGAGANVACNTLDIGMRHTL